MSKDFKTYEYKTDTGQKGTMRAISSDAAKKKVRAKMNAEGKGIREVRVKEQS